MLDASARTPTCLSRCLHAHRSGVPAASASVFARCGVCTARCTRRLCLKYLKYSTSRLTSEYAQNTDVQSRNLAISRGTSRCQTSLGNISTNTSSNNIALIAVHVLLASCETCRRCCLSVVGNPNRPSRKQSRVSDPRKSKRAAAAPARVHERLAVHRYGLTTLQSLRLKRIELAHVCCWCCLRVKSMLSLCIAECEQPAHCWKRSAAHRCAQHLSRHT